MKYVVVVDEQDLTTGVMQVYRRYLVAIAYRAYSDRGEPYRATSANVEEAFVFSERSAAEMAAVWVGGKVYADEFLTNIHLEVTNYRP